MRSRGWLLVLVAVVGSTWLFTMQAPVAAQSGSGIVISEFRFRGPLGASDEFIELFNAGQTPINVSGWQIRSSNNVVPPGIFTRATIPANTTINPGCYYLVANIATGGFSGGVTPNLTYTVGFADDGGVALTTTSTSVIIDQVGQGTVAAAFGEGTRLPMLTTNVNRGVERRQGGALGHVDTNNNFADFREILPGNPQNSNPLSCLQTKVYLPHEIQGAGAVSPIAAATSVTVRGVVTAKALNGFFMQTEPGMEDADAQTSEGLFASTSGTLLAAAQVGRTVRVTGNVAEFVPPADSGSAPVTQLTAVVSVNDLGSSSLPAPVVLTSAELSSTGSLDQLERFEGMRVTASITAVSGTDGGHAFYAVLSGESRPFRSEGVEAGFPVLPCAIGPCNVPLFSGNPQRLRVDSDGLAGVAPVALSSGATMSATGPLDFAARAYTLLPDTTLVFSGGTPLSVATVPAPDQFTVASLNLDRFYDATDDAGADVVFNAALYAARLSKASAMVRNVLAMPDVVAVQEVEKLDVLNAIASAIDADASAAGQAVPQYAGFVADGSHADSLDVGFLVKQAGGRVSVLTVEPVPVDPLVFERTPAMLRALVSGPATSLPQTLTVFVSHFDVASSEASARAKRQAQAEALGDLIQVRQSNDPSEAIVAVGNFNAHAFNDGYADVMGTVRGNPVSPDQVATEPHDLVSPDLVSGGDSVASSERYTSLDRGNAQTFDHVLMSAAVATRFAGLVYPRVNADFPEVLRGDASTPARLSTSDPVVAYFAFPPDVDPPVFDVAPGDLVAEATGPDGAVVTYESPSAHDNLDPAVNVICSPLSGSTFALGNTGVTCSTQDVAGNQATVSFTVTVQDTTAPLLTLPADITDVSPAPGKSVSFVATAADAVSPSPEVTCTPASGSTFPIGDTLVSCVATDAAGNTSSGSFHVALTLPVYGRLAGVGRLLNDQQRTWFSVDVQESQQSGERGLLLLQVRDLRGRPLRYFSATVTDVRFSNAGAVVFAGVGYWNGAAGYRFEAAAADNGEPGPRHDTFSVRIMAPDGTVVESVEGTLHDGNVQSINR